MGCSFGLQLIFFDREVWGEGKGGKKKSEESEKSEYSEDFLNSELCGARESEASVHKVVIRKCE